MGWVSRRWEEQDYDVVASEEEDWAAASGASGVIRPRSRQIRGVVSLSSFALFCIMDAVFPILRTDLMEEMWTVHFEMIVCVCVRPYVCVYVIICIGVHIYIFARTIQTITCLTVHRFP